MDFLNMPRPVNDKKLIAGRLLIAEPFLADPNFARSVILLCEHSKEGSIGFVLNQPTKFKIGDLLPDLSDVVLSVNQGGPVQLDTLHMLHRVPQLLGGTQVFPGVYWGGSYQALENIALNAQMHTADLRLLIGYSGWSAGQLEKEIEDGSWLVTDLSTNILFDTEPQNMWRSSIQLMGNKYAYLANMPVNPQLN